MRGLSGHSTVVFSRHYRAIRIGAPVLLLLLSTIVLVGNSYNPFLYFQF